MWPVGYLDKIGELIMTIRLKITRLDDGGDLALIQTEGNPVKGLKHQGQSEEVVLYVQQPILISELPNLAQHTEVLGRALKGAISSLKEADYYDKQEDKAALISCREYEAALRSLGID